VWTTQWEKPQKSIIYAIPATVIHRHFDHSAGAHNLPNTLFPGIIKEKTGGVKWLQMTITLACLK
jgi:hypothetical protein